MSCSASIVRAVSRLLPAARETSGLLADEDFFSSATDVAASSSPSVPGEAPSERALFVAIEQPLGLWSQSLKKLSIRRSGRSSAWEKDEERGRRREAGYGDSLGMWLFFPRRSFFSVVASVLTSCSDSPFFLSLVQGAKGGAPLDVVAVVKAGDTATLGALLSKGLVQPNGVDNTGRPFLVTAAKEGQLGAVKLLTASGANVNAVDAEKASALAWSAANGHVGVARYLLKKEAHVDSRDQAGSSALDWAASSGHTGVVNLLLSNGADPNKSDAEDRTALLWAAEKGHAGVVRALLARQSDARHTDRLGRNALILAAQMGHSEVVQALLESEVMDASVRDKQGMTALDHAASQGKAHVVKVMLARLEGEGAVALAESALGWACSAGNAAVVALFLERNVSTDATDRDGASCLSRAAVRGHYETARLLLEHGADANLADRKRNTPLHHTAFHGYTKVANLLLDKGAAPNLVNVFGQTALDRATQGRGGDTMRRLLEEYGGVYMQGEGGKKKKRNKKDGAFEVDGDGKKKSDKANGKEHKEPAGNCRFEKGKCPFGPKCRFSHGNSNVAPAASSAALIADEVHVATPVAASPVAVASSSAVSSTTTWAAVANGQKDAKMAPPVTAAPAAAAAPAASVAAASASANAQKKSRACPLWGRKGRCRFGDRCKYAHDPGAKGVKVKKEEENGDGEAVSRDEKQASGGAGAVGAPSALLAIGMVACERCATQLPASARFCLRCGAAVGNATLAVPVAVLPNMAPLENRDALRMSITAAPFVPGASSSPSLMPASMVRAIASPSSTSAGATGTGGGGGGSGSTSGPGSKAASKGTSPVMLFSAFAPEASLFMSTSAKYGSEQSAMGAAVASGGGGVGGGVKNGAGASKSSNRNAASDVGAGKAGDEDWEGDMASLGNLLEDDD